MQKTTKTFDQFANWDITVALRELGFTEYVGYSIENPNNRIFYPDPVNPDDCAICGKHKKEHWDNLAQKPFFCERIRKLNKPTLQGIINWFRDKHNIFIEIQLDQTSTPKFCISIVQYLEFMEFKKIVLPQEKWGLYRNYYEAQAVAIEVVLLKIKNRVLQLS